MATGRRGLHGARLIALCLTLAGGAQAAAWAADAKPKVLPDPFPGAARAYLLTIDDVPRWGHAVDQPHQPASLTKLLTALVLLEDRRLLAAQIKVTPAAATTKPTRIGLRAGDSLSGAQALAALLVHSANDACVALVAHAAPDRNRFIARMNDRAAALGMRASRFVDPCGYDAPGQHATATDLLRLARAAHADPLIARLVALPAVEFSSRAGHRYRLTNTNLLVGRLEGVLGMKTGYTSEARRCLIVLAERDKHKVWLVMLGSENRWWGAHRMINEAFDAASFATH